MQVPEVDEIATLTDDLAQTVGCGGGLAPPTCDHLVGHLSLAHLITRRRWAICRLTTRLARTQDSLLADYEARVLILEELGFLDKTTRSGCLTLKG